MLTISNVKSPEATEPIDRPDQVCELATLHVPEGILVKYEGMNRSPPTFPPLRVSYSWPLEKLWIILKWTISWIVLICLSSRWFCSTLNLLSLPNLLNRLSHLRLLNHLNQLNCLESSESLMVLPSSSSPEHPPKLPRPLPPPLQMSASSSALFLLVPTSPSAHPQSTPSWRFVSPQVFQSPALPCRKYPLSPPLDSTSALRPISSTLGPSSLVSTMTHHPTGSFRLPSSSSFILSPSGCRSHTH